MAAERCHRWLRLAAIGFAAFNLLSIFALDVREWLVYFDPVPCQFLVWPTFVVALPALAFLLPLEWNSPPGIDAKVWLALIAIVVAGFELLWLWQIAVASFCRAPDWTFYWPWEPHHGKFVPLNNLDLSEYLWLHAIGRQERSRGFLIREAPGLALVGIHFLAVPLLAIYVVRARSRSIALWRLLLMALAIQLMTFVLLKIALYCSVNVKYIIAWPEKMLNL